MNYFDPDDNSLEASLLGYLRHEWKRETLQYTSLPQPIMGGFETSILKIHLQNPPTGIPKILIVRIFKQYASPGTALRESLIQNAAAAAGVPTPQVFLSCSDSSVVGGEFNVMQYMSGKRMIDIQRNDSPELLARSQNQLHAIDANPIITALTTHGFKEERFTLTGRLKWIQRQILEKDCRWLQPGLIWLLRNKPIILKMVICHGDFHPLNILLDEGKISGILDWSSFQISDPAHDVASTKVVGSILALIIVPGAIAPNYVEQYLTAYRTLRPLDADKLLYFEVVRLIKGLLDGIDGQPIWRHRNIVTSINNALKAYSGLDIRIPQNYART